MATYTIQNERESDLELTHPPWFISTCRNHNDARQILESCRTIENGNFFVRHSESQNAKYTISIWFNNTITHVRIHQLENKQYQLASQPSSKFSIPTFSTVKELIDFYSVHDMKLLGHCQDEILKEKWILQIQVNILFSDNKMLNKINYDPYFDDEDDANEETYRQLLKKRGILPPCDPKTLPVSSLSQRHTLCSRKEAENILTKTIGVCPGNFIVRPSINANHPYSLSVLSHENSIYHFQIGQIENKYILGPLETVDLLKSKKFSSVSDFINYYLTTSITFKDTNHQQQSILLQLYSTSEFTRF
ncbi:unnamed protein product [Adineta steineri]|uniref:SH2 domain-containing protein n=1 Tax=Adineta steineri TaxID=433720 RepID=A0A815IM12_9BILA|nr:unnamed protein product [Adineta steineri]